MLLSQAAEHAVRAVLHIAAHQDDGAVRVLDTAAALRVPKNSLSKTLHKLARAGLLTSTRGPSGGFRLAMPAGQLSLHTIIGTFAAAGAQRCLLRSGTCGETPGCEVHARWAPIAAQMRDFFGTTTIADLLPALSLTSLRPPHEHP